MNYRFNEEQRHRLAQLELNKEQIYQLERSALPAAAAALAEEATILDLRDKLDAVQAAIVAARDATASLRDGRDCENSLPTWREAFQRIERAEFQGLMNDRGRKLRGDGEHIDRAYRALVPLALIVDHARDAFEREAAEIKKRQPGSWFPVQLIDEALRKGVFQHTKAEEVQRDARLPQYKFSPSSSETSKFLRVVAICYETIGRSDQSLEWSIRTYIKWKRKQGLSQ